MIEFVHGLDTKLRFGKYKGKTVEFVLETNPAYLVWCHRNIDWFLLDKKILSDAEERYVDYQLSKNIRRQFTDPSNNPYWFEDDNGSWLS